MMRLGEVVQWTTRSGNKLLLGEVTVTPRSQALVIRFPRGGWVWNRPKEMVVERNGQTECIPIADVTRTVRLALLALTLVLAIFISARNHRRRRSRNGR